MRWTDPIFTLYYLFCVYMCVFVRVCVCCYVCACMFVAQRLLNCYCCQVEQQPTWSSEKGNNVVTCLLILNVSQIVLFGQVQQEDGLLWSI